MQGEEGFKNRSEAGKQLGRALSKYRGRQDVVVEALARGGVVVGFEVAKILKAPLEALVVRKLGLPGHEELAMGAVGPGGVKVVNGNVAEWVSEETLEEVAKREGKEVERRMQEYRGGKREISLEGKTVILVDDGLATGSSMKAAVAVVQKEKPKALVVAVPVGAKTTCRALEKVIDELVCLLSVENLGAVGMWYEDFEQTTDREVKQLLVGA